MTCDVDTYSFLCFCIEKHVNISTIVTISLFILGYVIAKMVGDYRRKGVRNKYLIALLQEIELNISLLQKNIDGLPEHAVIEKHLRDGFPNYRPLITFSYDCVIYRSNTEVLQDLQDLLIRSIIQFYGRLDTIKIDIESIESKAFETLTVESRLSLFPHLKALMENGITLGESARMGIALHLRRRLAS